MVNTINEKSRSMTSLNYIQLDVTKTGNWELGIGNWELGIGIWEWGMGN